MRRRTTVALALTMAGALALAACSSDSDEDGGSSDATTTTAKAAPLRILVTNDDGVGADGIDALVQGLRTLPDVEVTVVAPSGNRSLTSDTTTPGGTTGAPATTKSGVEATAVAGYPADSVNYALDTLKVQPQVVVSGSNFGQNLAGYIGKSGTVGAGRTAVRRGIPAVAVSQGLGTDGPPNYSLSVGYALEWLKANRRALAAGKAPIAVVNINAPTCPKVRGIKTLPASASTDTGVLDCSSTASSFSDDLSAFNAGFATVTVVDANANTVTTTTTFPTK